MPEEAKQIFDRESVVWETAATKLGTLWCDLIHDSPMWPIHGQYKCRTCGRHYLVPWAGDKALRAPAGLIAAEATRMRQPRVPSFRSASVPLGIVLAILLASAVRAADAPMRGSTG